MDGKKVSLKVVDGKLQFALDPNQDGEVLVEANAEFKDGCLVIGFKVPLKEIPDEVIDAFKKDAPKA